MLPRSDVALAADMELRARRVTGVLCLFAASGVASGFTTVWIFSLLPNRDFGSAGVVFGVAIIGSLLLVRTLGWLAAAYPIKRCILVLAVFSISEPLAFWAIQFTQMSFEVACHFISTDGHCKYLQTLDLVDATVFVFAVGAVSIGLISLALRVLTQEWRTREIVCFFMAAAFTIWVSVVLTYSLTDIGIPIRLHGENWTFMLVLSVVGQASLATIAGKWIAQVGVRPAANPRFARAATSTPHGDLCARSRRSGRSGTLRGFIGQYPSMRSARRQAGGKDINR